MPIKVIFIAHIKEFNDEYRDYVTRVRDLGEQHPGFISLTSEEIGETEITISTWRSKEDVQDWAMNPTHMSAKAKWREWYHWVKGIHMEVTDDEARR